MKKKIIGLFVCILLVGTVVPVVEPLKTTTTTPMASSGITKFYSTDNWIEEEKLLASDGQEGDNFGCYVSLSGDTALVGAWLDGDNGYHSGSAYVFIRNNTMIPLSSEHTGMMITEINLGQCMYSPEKVPPGPNRPSSLPQTGQSWIILDTLFH